MIDVVSLLSCAEAITIGRAPCVRFKRSDIGSGRCLNCSRIVGIAVAVGSGVTVGVGVGYVVDVNVGVEV